MGGFIGMGQWQWGKSSLHFVPLIKVQAALDMTEAYSPSITVSKTVWMLLGNCKNALHAVRAVLNIFNEQLSTGKIVRNGNE